MCVKNGVPLVAKLGDVKNKKLIGGFRRERKFKNEGEETWFTRENGGPRKFTNVLPQFGPPKTNNIDLRSCF